jgi:hypothetical protein
MDLRPALQLQTAIKAMTDVVLPAVDRGNIMAQEQARLVIGMLHLALSRLPLAYRFERDELSRFLALAQTLQARAADLPNGNAALRDLSKIADQGKDVLSRAGAEPGELETAVFRLREQIGSMVTTLSAELPAAQLRPIYDAVTDHAHEQLLRERSWVIAQGWEADPKAIPPIETLIGDGQR